MADIVSDLGVNLLEEEIDEVIFQTNQFLTEATFTGSQGRSGGCRYQFSKTRL